MVCPTSVGTSLLRCLLRQAASPLFIWFEKPEKGTRQQTGGVVMCHAQPRRVLSCSRKELSERCASATEDMDAFLDSLSRKGLRPATIAKYRQSLHRFFAFARENGVRDVRYANTGLFLLYCRTRIAQAINRHTVSRDESRILAFYTWLLE